MTEQSLQTLILAAIAIVLLLQTTVLMGIAVFLYRARKPLATLMASTHGFLEIAQRAVARVDRELEQLGRMVDERAEQADVMARNCSRGVEYRYAHSMSLFLNSCGQWKTLLRRSRA